jgi:AAA domain-containing protein
MLLSTKRPFGYQKAVWFSYAAMSDEVIAPYGMKYYGSGPGPHPCKLDATDTFNAFLCGGRAPTGNTDATGAPAFAYVSGGQPLAFAIEAFGNGANGPISTMFHRALALLRIRCSAKTQGTAATSGRGSAGLTDNNINDRPGRGRERHGQTFLAIDLGLHIAGGREWFGRPTRQGGVVYIAAEAGRGIENRVVAYKLHYRDIPDDLPFAAIVSPVNLRVSNTAANIHAVLDAIDTAAAEFGMPVTLVIIDTLSRAMAGGDENSSEDMGEFVMNVDRLRAETGAHIQATIRKSNVLAVFGETESEIVVRPGRVSRVVATTVH